MSSTESGTEVEYVRRSRFEAGLNHPDLIGYLQAELQAGRIVVLEDADYLKQFPEARA